MCGIIGYTGFRNASSLLLEGIKKLEYRGYDSMGLAVIDSNKLVLGKGAGRIEEVSGRLGLPALKGETGIAHTRWATHGGVTDENAHPHTDCTGSIAVVHNGIIENYGELRAELAARGHLFKSETDTEVIPHLIEEFSETGDCLEKASAEAAKMLSGSYAFLAISAQEPKKMVALRQDSPLVIGIGEDGVFAASDVLAFLAHTKKVVYLENGEIAVLEKKNGVEAKYFEISSGRELQKKIQTISWSAEAAAKGGFQHFMLKEIMEQESSLKSALAQEEAAIEEYARGILQAKEVVLVACGTSMHAAMVGRHLLREMAGKKCSVAIASEYAYEAENTGADTLIVTVSQSGETADVLEVIKKVKARGARVFSIANVVGSSIARASEKTLYLNAGPEIGVAATKSFTSQLALFYLIAAAAAGKLKQMREELEQVPDKVVECIEANRAVLEKIARELKHKEHAYYIGRGANYAIALEGALKMKEISYVHAEGMPAGELKHGTLALIEPGTVAIVINPKDHTYNDVLGNAQEIKARGGKIVGVSDAPNAVYDELIQIPSCNPLLYPLLSIVPLQLLAYYAAVERGFDPDKPRNLAKSVTVK